MTKEEQQKKVDNFLDYFDGKEFKNKQMILNQAETITDLPRFIKYHISLIKRSHTKSFPNAQRRTGKSCSDRHTTKNCKLDFFK